MNYQWSQEETAIQWTPTPAAELKLDTFYGNCRRSCPTSTRPREYGGLNLLEVQMGVAEQRKPPAQHPKTTKAG